MKNIVFPEFEECARRMRALKNSGGQDAGLTQYRGGDAYLAVLTRLQTNSSKSVEETIRTLESEIDRIEQEMK